MKKRDSFGRGRHLGSKDVEDNNLTFITSSMDSSSTALTSALQLCEDSMRILSEEAQRADESFAEQA